MKLNYNIKFDPTKMLLAHRPKPVFRHKKPVHALAHRQYISPIPKPEVPSLRSSQNPPIFNSTLEEMVDNSRTDKNTIHSYLPLYQKLLVTKKKTSKNILEIGIFNGGSIKLWSDYFINATVYGLDIINMKNIWEGIKNKENIKLYTSTDAYNDTFFINEFLSKNIKFDFMLDDGPHTLESMKKFINLYSKIMTDDGILIIEDVQSWDWIDVLKNEVPENLKQFIKVYDLRPNKNRYDDIVFTIDKLNI